MQQAATVKKRSWGMVPMGVVAGIILLFTLVAGCAFGPVRIAFFDVAMGLGGWLHGGDSGGVEVLLPNGQTMIMARSTVVQIIMDLRLPRTLLALASGFSLALAGGVFQGILRNPLADPFTLGVSSGAACGAALAISLGAATVAAGFGIPLFALAGALGSLVVVLLLGGIGKGLQRESLVLAGIVVSAFLAAVISLIKALDESSVTGIVFWVMGSFQGRGWMELTLVLPGLMIGSALIFALHREVEALALGDEAASHLGVATARNRLILLVAASAVTAGCVAVSGIIGFVGLVVPHMCRLLWGAEQRVLLPASAAVGAVLLVWADIGARVLLPGGIELPVGVLTALLGGPFFCYLLYSKVTGKRLMVAKGGNCQQRVNDLLQTMQHENQDFTSKNMCTARGNVPDNSTCTDTLPVHVAIQNITVQYGAGHAPAVRDVSFTIPQRQWVGILGPNGSGKSSLLRCMAGVQRPCAGQILLEDNDVAQLSARKRALLVAALSQNAEEIPPITVLSLVLMGRYAHTPFLGNYSQQDYLLAYEALEQTGVAHLACRLASSLSGGELQRVFVAQSLAQHAPLLLLDEVTKGLDPAYQVAVLATVARLQLQHQWTVVAAMHDLNLAAQFCQRLIVMKQGRVVADGTVEDVFIASVLEDVYENSMTFIRHPQLGCPQVLFL